VALGRPRRERLLGLELEAREARQGQPEEQAGALAVRGGEIGGKERLLGRGRRRRGSRARASSSRPSRSRVRACQYSAATRGLRALRAASRANQLAAPTKSPAR